MNSKLRLNCDFILQQYSIHKTFFQNSHRSLPFVVGICGPQGSGKSTIAAQIRSELIKRPNKLNVVTMSLDDFYYGYDELENLKLKHGNCFSYQFRGPPGTHDIPLIQRTLDEINRLSYQAWSNDQSVSIPAYNKSYRGGKGDREPLERWPTVTEAVDIILFEGWMVGFTALDPRELEQLYVTYQNQRLDQLPNGLSTSPLITPSLPIEEIQLINHYLQEYNDIWQRLGCFIQLEVADLSTIYEWRLEQEVNNKQGLDRGQVVEFVKRFMPTYELCLPKLRWLGLFKLLDSRSIGGFDFKQHLVIQLDPKRNMVGSKVIGGDNEYSKL